MSRNPVLPVLTAVLVVAAVVSADGAGAASRPQLVDARGDSSIAAVPGEEAVDLLGVRLDGVRRNGRLDGLRIRMDLAAPALDNAATAYRVELYVGGCTLLVSAYDGRAQLLRTCSSTGVEAAVRLVGSSVVWDLPQAALGSARRGDLVSGIEARVVVTEGHDRYDASVLDRGETATEVRL
jgi:hypothetical protein